MHDAGPPWFKQELPQPIARAWHLATLEVAPDGFALANTVEVALRVVTAFQAASLLAEGGGLPRFLSDGSFGRPTLGAWIALVKAQRRAAREPFLPELRQWPGAREEALLDRIVEARNRLAHRRGVSSPGDRRAVAEEIAALVSQILASLDWLRGVRLFVPAHFGPGPDGGIVGHIQVYRSPEVHPGLERQSWIGEVELQRCYVAAASGARQALDVDPFIRRARLPPARSEALCLWGGFSERGEVLLRDDDQDATSVAPLAPGERRVTWRPRATSVSVAGLAQERRPLEPTIAEAVTGVPVARALRPGRRGRGKVLAAVGAALLAAGGVALALLGGSDPASAPTPVRVADDGAASQIDLAGEWRFDTVVLGSRSDMSHGLGVRGHYQLELEPPAACGFPGVLTKFSYTEGGERKGKPLVDDQCFAVSQSRRSIVASIRLRHPDFRATADISLRLTRHGDHLLGLWRHEGEDGARGGYSGALFGSRGDEWTDPRLSTAQGRCFEGCIGACHQGADPLAPESEVCLLECVAELERCPR